jgi:CRISPR-associated protein Cas2
VRSTYLVCYDISNDVRLRRVDKTMCGFGDRLQYSVFECKLSVADLARCKHALGKLIHNREDQVLFVDLGPAEGRGERVITALGRAYSTLDSPCIIVDRDEGLQAVQSDGLKPVAYIEVKNAVDDPRPPRSPRLCSNRSTRTTLRLIAC